MVMVGVRLVLPGGGSHCPGGFVRDSCLHPVSMFTAVCTEARRVHGAVLVCLKVTTYRYIKAICWPLTLLMSSVVCTNTVRENYTIHMHTLHGRVM